MTAICRRALPILFVSVAVGGTLCLSADPGDRPRKSRSDPPPSVKSLDDRAAALEAGYVQTLTSAGAVVTNATCGACQGGHMGVVGPNEVCITASTRNFKGRMGDPTASVYMASPATVAASAVTGVVTHPAEFLAMESSS